MNRETTFVLASLSIANSCHFTLEQQNVSNPFIKCYLVFFLLIFWRMGRIFLQKFFFRKWGIQDTKWIIVQDRDLVVSLWSLNTSITIYNVLELWLRSGWPVWPNLHGQKRQGNESAQRLSPTPTIERWWMSSDFGAVSYSRRRRHWTTRSTTSIGVDDCDDET